MRRTVLLALLGLVTGLLVGLSAPAAHAADKDCGDFATQKAAQDFFLANGGPSSDPHGLDHDGDGVACESNPCPCSSSTTGGGGTTTKPTIKQRARVLRVVDGDTVKVKIVGGRRRTVRLIGIDTPEVYGTQECGGPRASRSMKRMLPRGTRVRLVSDPTQDRVDRYGRLLRYVMKNGKDMNRRQVAKGWATLYVYDNTPFKRVKGYRTAQRRAKNAPRGVWKICS